jgi:hypothetical protein
MAKVEEVRSKNSKDSTFVLTTTRDRLKRDPIGELKDLHRVLSEVGNKGRMVFYSSDLTSSIIDAAVNVELVMRYTKANVRDPKTQLNLMDGERKIRQALVTLMEGVNDIRSMSGMVRKKKKNHKPKFEATEVGEGFKNENLKKTEAKEEASAEKPKEALVGFSLED